MPLYVYSCDDCKHKFEIRHGMFFENQRCVKCYSEHVFKVPSIGEAQKTTTQTGSRAGKVVDKYIEDVKSDIKEEKNRLKSEEL